MGPENWPLDLAEGIGGFEERHFGGMVRVKPFLWWGKGKWEGRRQLQGGEEKCTVVTRRSRVRRIFSEMGEVTGGLNDL